MATLTLHRTGSSFATCQSQTNSRSPYKMSGSSFINSLKKLSRRSSASSKAPSVRSRGRTPSNPDPFAEAKPSASTSAFPLLPDSSSEAPSTDKRPGGDAPPPPYTAEAPYAAPSRQPRDVSPAPSAASGISVQSLSTPEDPFAFLSTFDTIFLIDDSASMTGERWNEVRKVLEHIAPICTQHDDDGVDVYFLNHKSRQRDDPASGRAGTGYNIKDARGARKLFEEVTPCFATPTGRRLGSILNMYLRNFEKRVRACDGDAWATDVKPVNMIVITDGQPTDDPESVLRDVAEKLDRLEAPPYQVGVQFFQVGDDRQAAQALEHLDEHMAHEAGVRDIVDTVTWNARDGRHKTLTADAMLKVVLGAVVKRLDRQNIAAEASDARRFLSAGRY